MDEERKSRNMGKWEGSRDGMGEQEEEEKGYKRRDDITRQPYHFQDVKHLRR